MNWDAPERGGLLFEKLCRAATEIRAGNPEIAPRLEAMTALLWGAFAPMHCSWVGFYCVAAETTSDSLILACCRPKPACSPIGLHGVCGQAFVEGVVRIVEDVSLLGNAYVACDPRDRSELVVPIFVGGRPAGVLDLDSIQLACFDAHDADRIAKILESAGLLDRSLKLRIDRLPIP